ncbi:diguanylate cyclase [Qipengyuania sp. RANM35]|uniref:sensor domain-containing diguanylate cyclase n=1 Tax=Qipengyuania sp. RANM35 TaxID=3068635 RepID=UPI0034DADDAB
MLAFIAGFFVVAGPAAAEGGFAPASVCHISGSRDLQFADALQKPESWTCNSDKYEFKQQRHIVRLDLAERTVADGNPHFAEFERYEFERLTVTLVNEEGRAVSRSYGFTDTWLGASSLQSMVELPEIRGRATALVFTLDGGKWPEALAAAELVDQPSVPPIAGLIHLYAALICGLLLTPILFDLGYFRALREPFPLWHALFCAMAFVQTASVSGLIPLMSSIDFKTELYITYMSVDVMIAATMLFASNFIEPAALGRRGRLALLAIAPLALANGISTTFFPELFGKWIDHAYFGAYILMLGTYFVVLGQAWKRGSLMAPYLILGFAPFTSIIVAQFASILWFPASYTFDETWPQNFALLFEVVATALAVADRFIAIKRERDQAVDEARTLEALSEHDQLTGLLNRRALEARYETLVEEGFSAMAVLDIDHFKSINDQHGHPIGDAVLRCTGEALQGGAARDLVAFRIGGEEFLLLLRGFDARERAEALRRAVTVRTLAHIGGLDRPVTASMGFLDFSQVRNEAGVDFDALYTRVDQLLYDAKCAGRNRMAADKLELFEPEFEEDGGSTAAVA